MNPARVVAVALALGVLACASQQGEPRSPRETVEAYARALQEKRWNDAYALLSSDAKREVDFKTFEQLVKQHPKEIVELSASLLGPSEAPTVTAVVTGPSGESLTLYYESGAWKVDGATLDLYSQATPETAVAAFVRAYENQRYDVLLRFVPDGEREGLTADKLRAAWQGEQRQEMDQLTRALKTALQSAKFERAGDRATMSYGAGGTVELKVESDKWKIEEF